MKLDLQTSAIAKNIIKSFGLSNEQASIILDMSLSTWIRIKNDKFKGNLTKDQYLRIIYIENMFKLIKENGYNKNWLFTTGVLKSEPISPFELISHRVFLGVYTITKELSTTLVPTPLPPSNRPI